MNPMEEWSYGSPFDEELYDKYWGPFVQDEEYIGESAQNAVEYHILEDHAYQPHAIQLMHNIHGDISIRCTYCGKTLLEWERPEKED